MVQNAGGFKKGDQRINRKGAPKKISRETKHLRKVKCYRGRWEDALIGKFHCWGMRGDLCCSNYNGDTIATETIAIVESEDGSIRTFKPEEIQFI